MNSDDGFRLRLIGGDENLVRIVEPERRKIDEQMMPVRHRDGDLVDLKARAQRRVRHRIERVLHRRAVVHGEGLEHRCADALARREIGVGAAIGPRRGHRRGQDAIARFGQRRVLVARKTVEREVRQAGRHADPVAALGDHRRPLLIAALHECVRVRASPGRHPIPARLGGRDARK